MRSSIEFEIGPESYAELLNYLKQNINTRILGAIILLTIVDGLEAILIGGWKS